MASYHTRSAQSDYPISIFTYINLFNADQMNIWVRTKNRSGLGGGWKCVVAAAESLARGSLVSYLIPFTATAHDPTDLEAETSSWTNDAPTDVYLVPA